MRLANPKARKKAITSRPFLLYAIGRKSHHAGQIHLAITSLHAARALAKSCFARIHAVLGAIRKTAAQLAESDCWRLIVALVIATKPTQQQLLGPLATVNCGIWDNGHFDKLLPCNLSNRKAKSVVFALLHGSIT